MTTFSLKEVLKAMVEKNKLGDPFVLAFAIGVQSAFDLTGAITKSEGIPAETKQSLILQVYKDAIAIGNEAADTMKRNTALINMKPLSEGVN